MRLPVTSGAFIFLRHTKDASQKEEFSGDDLKEHPERGPN